MFLQKMWPRTHKAMPQSDTLVSRLPWKALPLDRCLPQRRSRQNRKEKLWAGFSPRHGKPQSRSQGRWGKRGGKAEPAASESFLCYRRC